MSFSPMSNNDTTFGQEQKRSNEAERGATVPGLSTLCFPHIQNLSLHPIDLSTPLPVTRLGCTSSDVGSGEGALGPQFMEPQNKNFFIPPSLKSRRFKCRKQVFYKMGLKNHWFDERKLISAVQNGELSKVTDLLDQGANPNVSDQKKRTPLHIAASQGQDFVVGLLLSKRADPNHQDILGNTPLHLAVCRGDVATVKVLIENGSNIFISDNSGRTPLSLVRNRLGSLCRNKKSSTDAFKTEFILMSEILYSPSTRRNEPVSFVTSIDDLCNQMQTVSTRERADEIAETAIRQMGNAVSAMSLSNIKLL